MVIELTTYETSDGQLFVDEDKAKDHQLDIIGELLDELLPEDDRGNVTRVDRHNLLMKQISDIPKLKLIINKLNKALIYG